MDYAELKVQLEAARRLEATVEGVVFELRLPSDYAWRVALDGNKDASGRTQDARAMREILSGAITGWKGLTARHFLPSAPADPVDFSPGVRLELLEARQDIADELAIVLAKKRAERRKQLEAERKNSSRASSGS